MVPQELSTLRNELSKYSATLTVLRYRIFRNAIETANIIRERYREEDWHKLDFSSKILYRATKRRRKEDPLAVLLAGPTCSITLKLGAQGWSPADIKNIVSLIERQGKGKLYLLGGRIDDRLMDTEGLKVVQNLPDLEGLRGQIVGLLQSVAAGPVRLLEQPGSQIAHILTVRKKQLEE